MNTVSIAQANNLFRNGKYDDALFLYDNLLKELPEMEWWIKINIEIIKEKIKQSKEFVVIQSKLMRKEHAADKLNHVECSINDFNLSDEECEEIIRAANILDVEFFKKNYPDWGNLGDIIHHYCKFGYKEGRTLSPFFDSRYYINKYNIHASINPLAHYIHIGYKLGYEPSRMFSFSEYAVIYGIKNMNPISHYVQIGYDAGYKLPKKDNQLKDEMLSFGDSLIHQISPALAALTYYDEKPLSAHDATYDPHCLNIHFVIPNFGIGGGGHMTIFRIVRLLEKLGHNLTIWIFSSDNSVIDIDERYRSILLYYQTIKAKIRNLKGEEFFKAEGDVVVATSWDTAYPVVSATNFKRRFYFIQDYEKEFYPLGSKAILAEFTYNFNLDCICASPWLQDLMEQKYKRWATHFFLAADRTIYYPVEGRPANNRIRIAIYSRLFTERRAVELIFMALEQLYKEGIDFQADLFGIDSVMFATSTFPCISHGVCSAEYLGELYRQCDIGIVFSLTNYSLVPQEMMACGLPVIEFDTDSTRHIFPEGVVMFAGPSVKDIKDKIRLLIEDVDLRLSIAKKGLEWVRRFSWEQAARIIEGAFIDRLTANGFSQKLGAQHNSCNKIHASIIIPTYNPGKIFNDVMSAVLSQDAPWNYEVFVIDSESTDGVVDNFFARNDSKLCNLVRIKKKEFGHGRTRNLGAEMSNGEYVVFLTHDSIPDNKDWLYNLVSTLERFPNAAGAFGKHRAHDWAGMFTRLEIEHHFKQFDMLPINVSKYTEKPAGESNLSWRQKLHYFSDNNSCLRRSVWEKIRFRDVKYGEDQLWAQDILDAGYEKVYAPTAIVRHSHDYKPEEVFERSIVDGDYFKYFFGYVLVEEDTIDEVIEQMCNNDRLLGYSHGLAKEEIKERMKCIEARLKGYMIGANRSVSIFS